MQDKPWNQESIEIKPWPAMISDEEKRYLHWIGKNWQGLGEIVEVGCWLGGSTTHLLMGLKENPAFNNKKLWVYDNFVWEDFYDKDLAKRCENNIEIKQQLESAGYFSAQLKSQDSFLPLFKNLCVADLDFMDINEAYLQESTNTQPKGDLIAWPSKEPIEVLFVDAAKHWYSLYYLFKVFAPYLIPGKSLIISQDYKAPYSSYWHVVFFELFSEYFQVEQLTHCGGTVTFRLIKEFPFPDQLDFPLSEADMKYADLVTIFEKVIQKWTDLKDQDTADHLRLPYAIMCHNKGHHKEAMKQIQLCWNSWHNKDAIEFTAKRYLNEPDLSRWGLKRNDTLKINPAKYDTFKDFLIQKAINYGFSEKQKTEWINYMQDLTRGEKLVESLISKWDLNSNNMARALDIGCGFGGLVIALSNHFNEVAGIEIEEDRVYWSKQRAPKAEIICRNATSLPWPNNHFDLIVSTDVFEHVPFNEQALIVKEIARVLKPGGFMHISVPNRFQVIDEHNKVPLATYLPKPLRRLYVKIRGTNKNYLHCFERTGLGWKILFQKWGLEVTIHSCAHFKGSKFLPPQRWNLYIRKQK